jgi:hypothetical protein
MGCERPHRHGVACLPGEFVGLLLYDTIEEAHD